MCPEHGSAEQGAAITNESQTATRQQLLATETGQLLVRIFEIRQSPLLRSPHSQTPQETPMPQIELSNAAQKAIAQLVKALQDLTAALKK
jgi:hypothetical protein